MTAFLSRVPRSVAQPSNTPIQDINTADKDNTVNFQNIPSENSASFANRDGIGLTSLPTVEKGLWMGNVVGRTGV